MDQGVIYFYRGPEHYADSLNALNAAWLAGALDKRIFYYSGILYEKLSLFEEALKQYQRFLNHEPEDWEIRVRLARLFFRMGQWDESVIQYEKLIKENERDVTSLINLGLAYAGKYEHKQKLKSKSLKSSSEKISDSENQELQRAIDVLEKAAKLQPEFPEGIYLSLAKLYFLKKDYEKCIFSCEAELKSSPANEIEALKLMALAYENINQKQNALEAYEKLVKKETKNSFFKQKIRSLKSQLKIK